MDTRQTELGHRIRDLRKTAGISGLKLGEQIGVAAQRISDWETGRRSPTWEQARALGEFFQRPPDEFLDEGSNSSSQPRLTPPSALSGTQPWLIPFPGDGPAWSATAGLYFHRWLLEDLDVNPLHCFTMKIVDSAMAPALPENSVCLVDRDRTDLAPGRRLFAFQFKTVRMVRRLEISAGKKVLKAEADDHLDLPMTADFVLLGTVIWTSHTLPLDD